MQSSVFIAQRYIEICIPSIKIHRALYSQHRNILSCVFLAQIYIELCIPSIEIYRDVYSQHGDIQSRVFIAQRYIEMCTACRSTDIYIQCTQIICKEPYSVESKQTDEKSIKMCIHSIEIYRDVYSQHRDIQRFVFLA